jgi:hypothetical protein
MPTHSLGTFFKILAYGADIALHVTKQNTILENRQNRQLSIDEATRQGCPWWYSDVTIPTKLTVCPLEPWFSSYCEFHLASQGHSGTPGKLQPRV